ncbi:MAG: class I SAM-dependent rRNA methyltransferase [Gammaproteobacteria bacterium]|nr:class I SAM-dependent rRNA methyltransferase [Gammaproteobacteria bacterium]
MPLPQLILKKHEDRRLRSGHLWVFSNEVDTAHTPLKGFAPGDLVEIRCANNRFIGSGYVNPNSLICARLLSRDEARVPDRALLLQRIRTALALRERLYPRPFYRLLFGEADNLPGLVADRYGQLLVVQITTAGMERMKADILEVLLQVLQPSGILLRNDVGIRELEGLPLYTEVAYGSVPEAVILEEHDCRFQVPLMQGQKTGWFFDQHDNRGRLRRYVSGRRVLDVFSYVGAWGVQAALHGARAVVCMDGSETALAHAAKNAALNGVQIGTCKADAFAALSELHRAGEKFDIVILDPPAFVKRKKDLGTARQAYRRINQLGMQLLEDDGLLVSCSCSYHMPAAELLSAVQSASRHLGREMQVLEQGGQAADHPRHPAIPETDYLKAFFLRVIDAG